MDSELRSELRLTGNKKNTRVLKLGHAYGDFYYNLYFSGALILSQFFSSNKNIAVTGKALLESLIVGSLASISIKFIFGRRRPYKEEGVFKFNWFETKNYNNSQDYVLN